MKRVFVGIKVNNELAREIVSWQKEQKVRKVRWTSRDNLHLTLVPPWQEKDVESVNARINKLDLTFPAFELLFNEVSFGPNEKRPRLIWAQGPVPHRIVDLKRKIEKNLGIIPEKEKFKFHITLGRFKERDFGGISGEVKTGNISWKMKVESFHLFESKLSSHGAEYSVLQEIKL